MVEEGLTCLTEGCNNEPERTTYGMPMNFCPTCNEKCYTKGCNNKAVASHPKLKATFCPTCYDEKVEPLRKYDDSGRLKVKKTTEEIEAENRIMYIITALGITGWLYIFVDPEYSGGLIDLGAGCGVSIIFVGFIMWITQSMFWR